MDLDLTLFVIIARGIIIPIFIWMTILLFLKYKKNSDKYYGGYFVYFIAISLFQIIAFIFELTNYINPSSSFNLFRTARFIDYSSQSATLFLYTDELIRPFYLMLFIIVSIGLSAQIFSVEILSNLKRRFLSGPVLFTSILVILIFIPAIRNSSYPLIAITTTITIVFVAEFFVIIHSLLIAAQIPGDKRKKSLLTLFGFFTLVASLILSTRVVWSLFWYSALLNSDYNIIIGSIIGIISVLLYYFAFRERKH